jgi:hypothetical protein
MVAHGSVACALLLRTAWWRQFAESAKLQGQDNSGNSESKSKNGNNKSSSSRRRRRRRRRRSRRSKNFCTVTVKEEEVLTIVRRWKKKDMGDLRMVSLIQTTTVPTVLTVTT